jgi:hypothetical protein
MMEANLSSDVFLTTYETICLHDLEDHSCFHVLETSIDPEFTLEQQETDKYHDKTRRSGLN